MAKDKKIKIPKSVLQLRWTIKKFAKKHNIRVKGKGLSNGEKKRNLKRLRKLYAQSAINGLNKAVKILTEVSPDKKKIISIRKNVEKIVCEPAIMSKIAKLYKNDPKEYPNMKYFPRMIMNTMLYYESPEISDEEKIKGEAINKEACVRFCERILKSEIKRYRNNGVPDNMAYELASVVPTTKMFKSGRQAFKNLLSALYNIAANEEVDLTVVLPAVIKVDKKKQLKKSEFYERFYSEFILHKASNKNHSFTDNQKELHESLIENTLGYLESIKKRKCKEILKGYIRRRKTAESFKNDTKRVIKFIDHANSNSSYTNIKTVIQELISDNSSNEIYLS